MVGELTKAKTPLPRILAFIAALMDAGVKFIALSTIYIRTR